MFNLEDAIYAAEILGINFDKFTLEEFLDGINVELEHGKIDELIKTAKIALAHLNEYPNYYNKEYGIKKFEEMLKNNLDFI